MLSGDRIKFLRYTHNKTQKEVADWADVTPRYIGMVESGQEIPTKETYNAILNCIYGIGKPVSKREKPNARKKATKDKE